MFNRELCNYVIIMATINFVVPGDLKKRALKKAIDLEVSLSAVLRGLLQEWVSREA